MKLKISVTLNIVLFALVVALVVRNELRRIDHAIARYYLPEKKPRIFDARGIPLPPERFDFRLHEPNEPPVPSR